MLQHYLSLYTLRLVSFLGRIDVSHGATASSRLEHALQGNDRMQRMRKPTDGDTDGGGPARRPIDETPARAPEGES